MVKERTHLFGSKRRSISLQKVSSLLILAFSTYKVFTFNFIYCRPNSGLQGPKHDMPNLTKQQREVLAI
jgi:hypothetical protein